MAFQLCLGTSKCEPFNAIERHTTGRLVDGGGLELRAHKSGGKP